MTNEAWRGGGLVGGTGDEAGAASDRQKSVLGGRLRAARLQAGMT